MNEKGSNNIPGEENAENSTPPSHRLSRTRGSGEEFDENIFVYFISCQDRREGSLGCLNIFHGDRLWIPVPVIVQNGEK